MKTRRLNSAVTSTALAALPGLRSVKRSPSEGMLELGENVVKGL